MLALYRRFGCPWHAGAVIRGARSGAGLGESEAALVALTLALALLPLSPSGLEIVAPHRPVSAWSSAGAMAAAREYHTLTLLPDGRALVVGGCDRIGYQSACASAVGQAELYDPRTGAWSGAGVMLTPRADHTATLLPDGHVLVAGGEAPEGDHTGALASAEVYDPRAGTWQPTGALSVPRAYATATLLSDGRVLAAGGASCDTRWTCTPVASAELYDPRSSAWTPTGSMSAPRAGQLAALLPDGRVLVAGGQDAAFPIGASRGTASAELYDPRTRAWTQTAPMRAPGAATATVLAGGTVLVTHEDGSAELYHPRTGMWTATGAMHAARLRPTATLLPDGRVLVAGGCCYDDPNLPVPASFASAEVYSPRDGVWAPVADMGTGRAYAAATGLRDGRVLVVGGCGELLQNGCNPALASAELYAHVPGPLAGGAIVAALGSGTIGTVGLARSIVLINSGDRPLTMHGVVVAGPDAAMFVAASACVARAIAPGDSCAIDVRFAPSAYGARVAELRIADDAPASPQRVSLSGYGADPRGWVPTDGTLATARKFHTATLLPDGTVLVTGGIGGGAAGQTAERYDPRTDRWSSAGRMARPRWRHAAVLLPDGRVLVVGGCNCADAEIYDPRTGAWTLTAPMAAPRTGSAVAPLPDGRVLVAGGDQFGTSGAVTPTAELYDPTTGTWSPTGNPLARRQDASVAVLRDGRVLVAGGCCTALGRALNSAEVYDPASGTWTSTGSLLAARQDAPAAPLADGRVLVAGGYDESAGSLSESELYDPALGTWQATGSMGTSRNGGTATVLPDGQVLVTGGACCAPGGATAELYDPRRGTWTAAPHPAVPRQGHSATLLPTSQVLVAGGDTTTSELYLSPGIALSPSAGLDFGSRQIGPRRAQRAITVADDSPITLTVGGATVVGPAVADFAIVSDHCVAAPLTPSGHCTIDVAFAPRARGTRVAELRIADDAPGGVQVVALSGRGWMRQDSERT